MSTRTLLPFVIALFCFACHSQARTVDVNTAKKYAGQVLPGNNPVKVAGPLPAYGYPVSSKYSVSSMPDPFYIFNSSQGGFVIIAGDDSVEPVIGYCTEGSFVVEEMPDNLKWWLSMWAEQIKINASRNCVPSQTIRDQWAALESGIQVTSSASKQYKTAQWGQGSPYNLSCPDFGGGRSLTGCVATATAIVMKHFKYPLKGNGTLSGYDYTSGGEKRHVDGHQLGANYDWDNMLLEYKGAETAAQEQAVAQLMYDVGVMCRMQYAPKRSEAVSARIPVGLKKYMGYDASSNIYSYSDYRPEDWVALIKESLDEIGPVCYGGQSSEEGGHEFVIDGYDSSDRFHINWGWEGKDNGYFSMGEFKDFKDFQDLVIFKPESGGADSRYLSIYSDNGSTGLSCNTQFFKPGVTFNVSCTYLVNTLFEDYEGKIAIGRISRDGELSEVVGETEVTIPAAKGGLFSFDVKFSEINAGDYMTVVTQVEGTDGWIPAKYDRTNPKLAGTISVDRSLGDVTSVKYTVSTGVFLVCTKADAKCTFKSESGEDASSATGWCATKDTLAIDTRKLTAGNYVLVLSKDAEVKSLTFTIGSRK